MSEVKRGPRTVYVCDKITLEVLREYPSVPKAAKGEDVSVKSVLNACRCRRVSRNGKVVYRFKDDYDPNESFEGKQSRPVLVFDVDACEERAYYTIGDVSRGLYVGEDSVSKAISSGGLMLRQYRLRYAR